MDRKLHLLESFAARGSDGRDYHVRGYEHLARDLSLIDAEIHWEPTGIAEYRLDTGEFVEMDREGHMSIPKTGVTLERTH